jgi:23S rRNA (guanosine2251-2'-O)-methyltransferase
MDKAPQDMIYGLHAVREGLLSERDTDKLFVNRNTLGSEAIKEIIQLANEKGVPIIKVPEEKLNRFTRKNHQGVVAFFSAILYSSIDYVLQQAYEKGKDPFVLVLDGVTDVRNFGALSRTAECMGVNGILIPTRGSAQINQDAMKTSSGALNYLPVARTMRLKDEVKNLKNSGLTVVGITEKGADVLGEHDLTGPIALVLGNEETGITKEILTICDQLIQIPMTGKVSSLNVSVAAAMGIFEVQRQRRAE